jgi:Tfp pilus assembly protein PilN
MMNRFNYQQSPLARRFGGVPVRMLAERLRLPMAVMGAAVLALASTWLLETHRIADLDADLSALQLRVQSASSDRIRAEHLTATVARLEATSVGIDAARREALAATNTIAQIGNDLPEETWLTGVGATPAGTWTISGRSTRVNEIGTMLRRVQSIDKTAATRLVSIAATGRTGRILDFVIGWDRRP